MAAPPGTSLSVHRQRLLKKNNTVLLGHSFLVVALLLCLLCLAQSQTTGDIPAPPPSTPNNVPTSPPSALLNPNQTCTVSPQSALSLPLNPLLRYSLGSQASLISCNATNANSEGRGPLVPCSRVPIRLIRCILVDATDDVAIQSALEGEDEEAVYFGLSSDQLSRYACAKWGSRDGSKPQTATALCSVSDGIECCGERIWEVPNVPCVRFRGYSFATAFILAVFLGCFGADRCYTGYACCLGVAKGLTLGGLGVWAIVDIALLCAGSYWPADGSNWELSA